MDTCGSGFAEIIDSFREEPDAIRRPTNASSLTLTFAFNLTNASDGRGRSDNDWSGSPPPSFLNPTQIIFFLLRRTYSPPSQKFRSGNLVSRITHNQIKVGAKLWVGWATSRHSQSMRAGIHALFIPVRVFLAIFLFF